MKGQFTVTFSAKEAVALLSNESTPKSLTNKIVKAFREAAITPVGGKNSIVSRATTKKAPAKKTKLEAVSNAEKESA